MPEPPAPPSTSGPAARPPAERRCPDPDPGQSQGETVNSLVGAGSALTADPSTLFDVRPYPGAPAGDADVYLKPSVFVDSFAQDLPRREALLLAATQRPLTLAAGNEPSGAPAWRTIPS